MKQYILALLILTIAYTLMAEIHSGAGDYGYKFLNIPINPVGSALAGRGVHSSANIASWILQPASTAMNQHKSVSASHSTWIGDTAFSSLMYSNARRNSHIGLALRNLSYGEIDKRDENGLLLGTYSPTDIGVSGNYARRITPSLYVGANLSVAYQKLDTASALALVSDLGVTSLTFLEDSKLSFALRNLGISNKMDEERVKLPHSFDLDVYKGFTLGEQHLSLETGLVLAADADIQTHFAAELTLLERFNLRTGYRFNSDAAGLSAGFGIALARFNIDYGFAGYSEGLGDVHSFGLSYQF